MQGRLMKNAVSHKSRQRFLTTKLFAPLEQLPIPPVTDIFSFLPEDVEDHERHCEENGKYL